MPGRVRRLMISLAVSKQYTRMSNGQTDGQTPADGIASSGKNEDFKAT